jgi:hypothetical protein
LKKVSFNAKFVDMLSYSSSLFAKSSEIPRVVSMLFPTLPLKSTVFVNETTGTLKEYRD